MLLYMMGTNPNVIPFLVVLFPEHTLLYELCLHLLLFSFVKKHLTRVNFGTYNGQTITIGRSGSNQRYKLIGTVVYS